jgi:hypothetical protein
MNATTALTTRKEPDTRGWVDKNIIDTFTRFCNAPIWHSKNVHMKE